jgi:signal transduction histidine kinase
MSKKILFKVNTTNTARTKKVAPTFVLFVFFLFSSLLTFAQQYSGETIKRRFKDSVEAASYAQEAWKNRTLDVIKSVRSGEKAVQIAQINDFYVIHANALIYLGITYRHMGDFVKSFEYTDKALEISSKYNYQEGVGWANIGVAALHYEEGKYADARMRYENALAVGKKIDQNRLLSAAYYGISQVLKSEKKFDEALNLLQNAYKIRSLENDASNIALTLSDIGEIYALKGNEDAALLHYHKAKIFAAKKRLLAPDVFPNLYRLAKFHLQKKQLDSLLYYQVLSEQAAHASNIASNREKSLKLKAETHALLGQHKQAFDYLSNFIELHDSLHNRESQNRLLALEELSKIKHREREENLLKRENALAEDELKKQQSIIFIFCIFVLILGALAMIFYRQHRKELAANHILEARKKKIDEINAKLEEQKSELERSNAIKDKLFSIISHDLRSPINSLTGTLTLMQMNALAPDEWAKLSSQIVFDLKQSAFLLENLLSWAKTQMYGFKITATDFLVNSVIRENADLMRMQAVRKSIALETELEEDLTVHADIDSVRLVLRNLLANAVKFTKPDGKICVRLRRENNCALISVTDNGVGISENISESIFSKNITSTPGTNKERGTGLGLLLSKEFTEKNGGELTFSSTPGEGSVFTFSLPLAEKAEI